MKSLSKEQVSLQIKKNHLILLAKKKFRYESFLKYQQDNGYSIEGNFPSLQLNVYHFKNCKRSQTIVIHKKNNHISSRFTLLYLENLMKYHEIASPQIKEMIKLSKNLFLYIKFLMDSNSKKEISEFLKILKNVVNKENELLNVNKTLPTLTNCKYQSKHLIMEYTKFLFKFQEMCSHHKSFLINFSKRKKKEKTKIFQLLSSFILYSFFINSNFSNYLAYNNSSDNRDYYILHSYIIQMLLAFDIEPYFNNNMLTVNSSDESNNKNDLCDYFLIRTINLPEYVTFLRSELNVFNITKLSFSPKVIAEFSEIVQLILDRTTFFKVLFFVTNEEDILSLFSFHRLSLMGNKVCFILPEEKDEKSRELKIFNQIKKTYKIYNEICEIVDIHTHINLKIFMFGELLFKVSHNPTHQKFEYGSYLNSFIFTYQLFPFLDEHQDYCSRVISRFQSIARGQFTFHLISNSFQQLSYHSMFREIIFPNKINKITVTFTIKINDITSLFGVIESNKDNNSYYSIYSDLKYYYKYINEISHEDAILYDPGDEYEPEDSCDESMANDVYISNRLKNMFPNKKVSQCKNRLLTRDLQFDKIYLLGIPSIQEIIKIIDNDNENFLVYFESLIPNSSQMTAEKLFPDNSFIYAIHDIEFLRKFQNNFEFQQARKKNTFVLKFTEDFFINHVDRTFILTVKYVQNSVEEYFLLNSSSVTGFFLMITIQESNAHFIIMHKLNKNNFTLFESQHELNRFVDEYLLRSKFELILRKFTDIFKLKSIQITLMYPRFLIMDQFISETNFILHVNNDIISFDKYLYYPNWLFARNKKEDSLIFAKPKSALVIKYEDILRVDYNKVLFCCDSIIFQGNDFDSIIDKNILFRFNNCIRNKHLSFEIKFTQMKEIFTVLNLISTPFIGVTFILLKAEGDDNSSNSDDDEDQEVSEGNDSYQSSECEPPKGWEDIKSYNEEDYIAGSEKKQKSTTYLRMTPFYHKELHIFLNEYNSVFLRKLEKYFKHFLNFALNTTISYPKQQKYFQNFIHKPKKIINFLECICFSLQRKLPLLFARRPVVIIIFSFIAQQPQIEIRQKLIPELVK